MLVFSTVILLAADESWKDKSIQQWDDRDAKQVLADSPWSQNVKLDQVRNLSKFERRDSGNWEAGIGPTVGLDAFDFLDPYRQALALARAHARPDLGSVMVRWESALPVRSAEARVGETDPPMWQGDYYVIAVHDIPIPFRWNLANELRRTAYIKRDKKKDLRPARVLISRHDERLATVVYLFPRSAEIARNEHHVRFIAQIDRLFVSNFFFPEEMQLQGQWEF
jgi:hypothetical protein